MTTSARLALYAVALLATFVAAFFTAGAVVPEETVQTWTRDVEDEHSIDDETPSDDVEHDGGQGDH